MKHGEGSPNAAAPQPLRSLLEAGVPLALGSDGPPSPFLNVLFASTHPANPREAITREQAVVAYTRGSAWAEAHFGRGRPNRSRASKSWNDRRPPRAPAREST